MKQIKNKKQFAYTLVASACLLLISACGGGGDSTPVNTPPTSSTPGTTPTGTTTSGTVTGFGSVIVDGTRIDDSSTVAVKQNDDGTEVKHELKIGDHVEVDHDDNLKASKVVAVSSVEGSVEAVDTVANTLKVSGQTVNINKDSNSGPITVFEAPYTSLADVKVNDLIEIHGITKTNSSGVSYIQATRIEQKVSDNTSRVHGIVKNLTKNSTFVLGELTIDFSTAKLLPEGATLHEGDEVHVSIPLGTVKSGEVVKAKVIKIKNHKIDDSGKKVELGGAISSVDLNAKTMVINGVTVNFTNAQFDPFAKTPNDLKPNVYLIVKGSYDSNGILNATKLTFRGEATKDGDTELHGTILNYVSNSDFTVRDVKVDASKAAIDAQSCVNTTLHNNLQVEVKGNVSSTGVVNATTVKCEQTDSGSTVTVIGRVGVVNQIDANAKTFSLTTDKEIIKVMWTDNTLFIDITSADFIANSTGKAFEVEGVLNSNKILVVSKIKVRK